MKIFSNGYQVFKDEQEARSAVMSWITSSRAIASRYSYCVGEIQEKTKVEQKGIRHIFYFHNWTTKKCEKPCITSYSYLERNIGGGLTNPQRCDIIITESEANEKCTSNTLFVLIVAKNS